MLEISNKVRCHFFSALDKKKAKSADFLHLIPAKNPHEVQITKHLILSQKIAEKRRNSLE